MQITIWTSSESDGQREEDDQEEGKDLDERREVFKPGEPFIRQDEDSE